MTQDHELRRRGDVRRRLQRRLRRQLRRAGGTLRTANIPIYQIAAPAQAWNAFGATTNALLTALGDASHRGGTGFAGVVLAGGSHVDSMLGVNPLFDVVLQLVTGRYRPATPPPSTR